MILYELKKRGVMMNCISKIVIIGLLFLQIPLTALPLIIINSMFGTHTFFVTLSSGQKKVILAEQQRWSYDLKNESVVSI